MIEARAYRGRVDLRVLPDARSAAQVAAALVAEELLRHNRPTLGLATGTTMAPVYDALIALHRRGEVSFASTTAVLLDDYLGLPPGDPRAFRAVVTRQLLDHVDLPDGALVALAVDDDPARAAAHHEERIRAAGGIDLQLLGIGLNGHIGFNEPGSSFGSRTRRVPLSPATRAANGLLPDGPTHALTMGIRTILGARRLLLVATGEHKAEVLARAVSGPLDRDCPASALRLHPRCTVVADHDAASRLACDGEPTATAPSPLDTRPS